MSVKRPVALAGSVSSALLSPCTSVYSPGAKGSSEVHCAIKSLQSLEHEPYTGDSKAPLLVTVISSPETAIVQLVPRS
jgi:hypothetical protein